MDRTTSADRSRVAAEVARDGYVAVVCITHNSANVIHGLLDSVPDTMGGHRVEVHVVDSGSSDMTLTVVRSRAAPSIAVHLLDGNRGFAAGINEAVRALALRDHRPSAVIIVNPDVRFRRDTADRLLATMERDRYIGIAAPRLETPEGHLQMSLRNRPSATSTWSEAICGGPLAYRLGLPTEVVRDLSVYSTVTDVGWATGGFLAVSWRCLRAVGPWDESFFLYEEEVDFCLRAADQGFLLRFVPTATAVRILDAGRTRPWIQALMRVNRVRHVHRRDGAVQAAFVRVGLLIGDALRAATGRAEARAGLWALVRNADVDAVLRRYRPDARAVVKTG